MGCGVNNETYTLQSMTKCEIPTDTYSVDFKRSFFPEIFASLFLNIYQKQNNQCLQQYETVRSSFWLDINDKISNSCSNDNSAKEISEEMLVDEQKPLIQNKLTVYQQYLLDLGENYIVKKNKCLPLIDIVNLLVNIFPHLIKNDIISLIQYVTDEQNIDVRVFLKLVYMLTSEQYIRIKLNHFYVLYFMADELFNNQVQFTDFALQIQYHFKDLSINILNKLKKPPIILTTYEFDFSVSPIIFDILQHQKIRDKPLVLNTKQQIIEKNLNLLQRQKKELVKNLSSQINVFQKQNCTTEMQKQLKRRNLDDEPKEKEISEQLDL
ncbi:Conserved_hypothetical protein [Hexamita inflata]|uniref:Uncharacterized protein n=1 Tax=Hexamita inflata TaxID=28002 RepID=A0AA86TT23_9EUKA|nr:Conserved hypothetical protein [Hexamita inflata]